MNGPRKFTIDDLKQQIDALLIEYPELSDDEHLRADVLEGETDLSSVMARIIDADAIARGMQSAISDRSKGLSERKARYGRKSDALRSLAMSIMRRGDIRKLELPEGTISVRSVAPSVEITDETIVPIDMGETVWRPSKKLIKEALEDGHDVPGAHLTNGSETISIRVK